jgi:hypothetical protein
VEHLARRGRPSGTLGVISMPTLHARLLARPVAAFASALLAVGFLLATAIPAAACSCVAPQPMSAYAGSPDQVVFTGVVQVPDGRGVPVKVTHWFQGTDPAQVVWLDHASFGLDGVVSSCGTALPPAGAEWIFVAWKSEGSELSVNLCTPHAAASDPTGQAMFKDAIATFGEGIVPGMDESASSAPTDGSGVPVVWLAGGAIALVIAVGSAFVLLRSGRGEPDA